MDAAKKHFKDVLPDREEAELFLDQVDAGKHL